MSRNKPSRHRKRTGTGSKDLSSVKADGFPNEEGDMTKKQKQQTSKREWVDPRVNPEPINPKNPKQTTEEFMNEIANKMAESLGVPADALGYESPSYSSAREDAKAMQEADKTLDPIREMVASFKQDRLDALMASIPKEGELHSEPGGEGPPSAIGVTYDPWTDTVSRVVRTDETGKVVEDYKPIPREDEARPCTLCESRRPIGTSYSRVYCTKSNARYCKCSYCGHTWTQERK
jgi:hypothetical protein